MKFLADMGISLRTVDWLRDKGHDVVHLRDEGLQRLPDDEILEKALLEQNFTDCRFRFCSTFSNSTISIAKCNSI